MRVKIILGAAIIMTCFISCVIGSFFYGLRVGAQNGSWRADTETAATLVHALKLKEAGQVDRSSQLLETLLYLSAYTTDRYMDNILLTKANRDAGEKHLQAVADYYWRHPQSFSLKSEATNTAPAGPVLNTAIQPALDIWDERHKRISAILISRKRAESERPARESRAIRSETNSMSSEAGSRR